MSKNQPASQKLIMKLQFEELGVIRRAALNLLPNVQDPEYRSQMQFSRYKSSRKYKFLSDDNNTVTLEGGYRLCRATRYIPVDQRYFWEVDFTAAKSSESHVRIGISTIQADMEAPVGVDSYGYCVADLGKRKTFGRRKIFPAGFSRQTQIRGKTFSLRALVGLFSNTFVWPVE